MPLVLAPRGDNNRFSQDSFVFEMLAYGFSVLKKGKHGYDFIGEGPDFVVSHNPDDLDDSLFLRKFRNVPSVVHLHYQLQYYTDWHSLELSLSNTRAAIGPTQFLAKQVVARFPDVKCHVVSNGVRKHLFNPSNELERARFRQQNGLGKATKLVGYVGRLTQAKGLDILEMICKQIAKMQVALVIQFPFWHNSADLGECRRSLSVAQRLKELAPEKVILYPDKSPRLAPRPLRFLDALLMPSLSEVQPMVVLEALASGVPVIGTRATPFFDELLESKEMDGSCQFVDLPSRFRVGDSKLDRLHLQELHGIVSRLIELLEHISSPSDAQRISMARNLPAKYVDVEMYRKWTRVYSEHHQSCIRGTDASLA